MSIYSKSDKSQPVVIRRPIVTTTNIQAFGSGDNFSAPFDLFGDDETIRVVGTVVAADAIHGLSGQLGKCSVVLINLNTHGDACYRSARALQPPTN